MDERLLSQTLVTAMVLLDHVVDLADGRAHQERQYEREDVPVSCPKEDVDAVEDPEESESPLDGVDDDLLAACCKLEEHGAEE